MKTRLLLVFLIFTNVVLFAQDTIPGDIQPDYRPSGRFYIGGFISPDLSYSIIPRDNTGSRTIKNYNSNYDISKFSVTVGFEAMYQISQHLAVTMGLQYSGKGGKTQEIEYYPSGVASDPVNTYYVYDYRFIDIPVRLDLYFSKRKISPFITAGVSTNIFINQRTHSFGVDENNHEVEYTNSSTSGFSAINPQLEAGAGVDIALRYSRLRIFPIYRVTLTDMNLAGSYNYSGAVVKGKLYSIGLGINYLLRL